MNLNPFRKKSYIQLPDEEMRLRNIKRARTIKSIAGYYFDQAPANRSASETSVVVPAQILLKLWDLADRLVEDI